MSYLQGIDYHLRELQELSKKADSATMTPERAEIEQSFSDQSWEQLQVIAGKLTRRPYFIGFELVHTNEKFTRLVGVTLFKVRNTLLLVPAIFSKGHVQGQILVYDDQKSMFLPLTPDWAEYLVANAGKMPTHGSSFAREDMAKINDGLRYPGLTLMNGQKLSSKLTKEEFDRFENSKSAMFHAIEEKAIVPEILPDALTNRKDATRFVDELAKAATESYKWADIIYGTDIGKRASAVLAEAHEKPEQKVAASPTALSLQLVRGKPAYEIPETHRAAYVRDGFTFIADKPMEGGVVIDSKRAGLEHLGEGHGSTLESAVEGNYTVWDESLNPVKARFYLVQPLRSDTYPGAPWVEVGAWVSRDGPTPGAVRHRGETQKFVCGIGDNGKVYIDYEGRIAGERLHPGDEGVDPEWVCGCHLKVGKSYLSKLGGNVIPYVIQIKSRDESVDGLITYQVTQRSFRAKPGPSSDIRLLHNPDRPTNLERGLIGGDALFFETNPEESSVYGRSNLADFDTMLSTLAHSKMVSLGEIKQAASGEYEFLWNDHANAQRVKGKIAATLHLIRETGADPIVCQDIVNDATAHGSKVTAFRGKYASAVSEWSLNGSPNWENGYNDQFGVETQSPETFSADYETTHTPPPESQIGDSWDPVAGRGFITSSTPEALGEFAQKNNIPHLLDHAAVGELAKTYDGTSILGSVLPKMEAALDAMGRMYFLLVWKPEDFKKIYGQGDIEDKTASFAGAFKQIGDLVLELIKGRDKLYVPEEKDQEEDTDL